MTRYRITFTVSGDMELDVEAEDEASAHDAAWAAFTEDMREASWDISDVEDLDEEAEMEAENAAEDARVRKEKAEERATALVWRRTSAGWHERRDGVLVLLVGSFGSGRWGALYGARQRLSCREGSDRAGHWSTPEKAKSEADERIEIRPRYLWPTEAEWTESAPKELRSEASS